MPLFYQQHINQNTRLAIWEIEETEEFFSATIPINKNITHPHKKLQHYAGRYLLRYLFPDFPYEEILIADTKKPYLENEAYHFSISHCGDYAAAIVSKEFHVGIDIEIPVEKILKIKHKFVSENEDSFVVQLPLIEQIELSTLIWSAKESLYKWYGASGIDFKTMLLVDLSTCNKSNGKLLSKIKNKEVEKDLLIEYNIFKELCLSFIYT